MVQQYLDCYTRVSTDSQEREGNSLEVQESAGEQVAKKLGLKFRLRNEGSRSSTIHYREVLEELKEDIKKGSVKNIWCQDRSRMFRDMTDGLLFRRDYLEKYRISLYEGEGANKLDYDNEDEKVMYDIITRLQEYENKKRSEKSQRGKVYKLQNYSATKAVYMGGTALFGYSNIDKLWKVNAAEATWVRWIFDAYERGMSTRVIKDHLDKAGLKTRRTRNGLWNVATLQKMLRNKSYTGIHTIHIKKLDKTYSYKIPKIINVGQFNRVQKALARNLRNHSNNKQHFSLLEDILVCECGTHIGSRQLTTTSSLGYKVNTRKYYCLSKEYDWKDDLDRNCSNKSSLQMDQANQFVVNFVKETVRKSTTLKERFKTDVLEAHFKEVKDVKATEARLERKVQRLQSAIDSIEGNIVELEVDIGLGKRDKSIADRIIARYYEELEATRQEYIDTERAIDESANHKKWLDWVGKYGEQLEFNTSSEKKQRDWLLGLLDKIVVRSKYGNNREGDKQIQRGHSLDFYFRMKIVGDSLRWLDDTDKKAGYEIETGRKLAKSEAVRFIATRSKRGSAQKKTA